MDRRTWLLGSAGITASWMLPVRQAQDGSWPPEVIRYVREYQERGYLELADSLGLSSARSAYQRISQGRKLPPDLEQKYRSVALPTPYEDPAYYFATKTTFEVLSREVNSLGLSALPRGFLATLASGEVNARTKEEPTTKTPVIFFEHGLFSLFRDMADLMAWAAPPLTLAELTDDGTLATTPRKHTMPLEASMNFAATLYAYVVSGNPFAEATPMAPPSHNMELAILLLNHMQRFAMVHEFAHLRKDLADRPQTPELEYDADAASVSLVTTLALKKHGSWAVGFWASELVLITLNLLYRAIGLFAFGPEKLQWSNPTHPDPLSRDQRLRGLWLDRGIPQASVAAAREMSGMTEALIQRLWEISLPGWLVAYNRGARTSPRWKKTTAYLRAPTKQ